MRKFIASLCVLLLTLPFPVFASDDTTYNTADSYTISPGALTYGTTTVQGVPGNLYANDTFYLISSPGTYSVSIVVPNILSGGNLISTRPSVQSMPKEFILTPTFTGFSNANWSLVSDTLTTIIKPVGDRSYHVNNFFGENLRLVSSSATLSTAAYVSLRVTPYDSNLYDHLDVIANEIEGLSDSLISSLSEIQYSLDRDGYSNLQLDSIYYGNKLVSFSYYEPFRMYKIPSNSVSLSGGYLRLHTNSFPSRSVSNGVDFYVYIAYSPSMPEVIPSEYFGLILSPSPVFDVSDILVRNSYSYRSFKHNNFRSLLISVHLGPENFASSSFIPSSFTLNMQLEDSSLGNGSFEFVGDVYISVWCSPTGGDISDVTSSLNRIDSDNQTRFQQSVNPSQSQATNELQSQIDQSENFDKQVFQDVNNYIGQLDFGLTDWSDAISGISYISNVFMIIWNNSPTQIITLSLMLGVTSLLLGRGARIAGEARRSQQRAERSQRRTSGRR